MKHLSYFFVAFLMACAVDAGAQDKKEKESGWKVGDLMPFHVVDFAAGPRKEGGGCPSVMISNAQGRGVIIWSKSDDKQAFQLAAALDGLMIRDKNRLGYLVRFGDVSTEALAKEAEAHALKNFHTTVPRSLAKAQFSSADVTGKAGTLVFFLDRKEIKSFWATEPSQMTKERIQTIAKEAEKFFGDK